MKNNFYVIVLLCIITLAGCASETEDNPSTPGLTLGCFGETEMLQKAVEQYNRQSSCTISIVDYWEEDMTAAVNRMYRDILAGNGPDIIQFDSQNINDIILGSEHRLADLTVYLEESQVVHEEDLVQPLYEALKVGTHLYMLPTNFGLETILTKEKWAGETGSWTPGECLESLTKAAAETKELAYGLDRQEWMRYMRIYGLAGENSGNSSADAEILLQIADCLPEQRIYIPDESIRRNGGMFWESVLLCDVEGYLYHKSAWEEDYRYTGLPGAEGNGMAFLPVNCYGINSDCQYKEEAWKFIESFFTEAWQKNITPNWNFSVCKSILAEQLDNAMNVMYYQDTDGNRKEQPVLSYEMTNGEIIDVLPAKQEDIDEIKSMIDKTVLLQRQDPEAHTGSAG